MEKKGSSDINESRSKRRETSERKAEQADSKDEAVTTGDPPAVTKNRRKRASDENGWMTNASEGTGSRHAVSVPIPVDDDEPKDSHTTSANREKHLQDDNDEIILIPDLDEDGGADSDQRIAHAPRNVNRRIPTLKDLENEVKAAVPTSEEGLNLSVLLSTLVPSGMVREEDTAWTFESLLREITDELSNTPKTVINVINPTAPAVGAKTAAAAGRSVSPLPGDTTGKVDKDASRTGAGGKASKK